MSTVYFSYLHPETGMLYQKRDHGLCILDAKVPSKKNGLRALLIDNIYHMLAHFGVKKTLPEAINRPFYWRSPTENVVHGIKQYHD